MYCLICWIAWLAAQCYGSSQWLFFPPILLLLPPLISNGSNSNVLEVLSGFDVTVHKNIYKAVIRVLGVAAFVLGKPPPPLWGQQHNLWEGWQLYKVFFEAGSTPSAPVVHPSFLVFLSKMLFTKVTSLFNITPCFVNSDWDMLWTRSVSDVNQHHPAALSGAAKCCTHGASCPWTFCSKGQFWWSEKGFMCFGERCWQEHQIANLT